MNSKKSSNSNVKNDNHKISSIFRFCYWIMFWGLLISIIMQMYFTENFSFNNILGETIIFFGGSLSFVLGSLLDKSESSFKHPKPKLFLLYSLIASLLFSILTPVHLFFTQKKSALNCIVLFSKNFICLFILCIAVLGLFGMVCKMKKKC